MIIQGGLQTEQHPSPHMNIRIPKEKEKEKRAV